MSKGKLEVEFFYGNKDFETLIKEVVLKKLNIYKDELLRKSVESYNEDTQMAPSNGKG